MQGDYQLLRQGGGRTAFAHVYVRILSINVEQPRVIFDVDPKDDASVLPEQEPEFFDAARQGCLDFLHFLTENGIQSEIFYLAIVRLTINRVDTQPDAVYTAAFLAAASICGFQDYFKPRFDGRWRAIRSTI